jgi:PAS domain S-box-containing protein
VLLEQLPSAVAVLDNDLRYLAANQRWRREFQLHGMPVLGQSHYELFPDLHHGWRDLYSRCLAGQRERMDDEVIVRPDGQTEWMRWDVQPWRDESAGAVGGIILSAMILTEDTRDKATLAFEQNLACSLLHSPLAPVVMGSGAVRNSSSI